MNITDVSSAILIILEVRKVVLPENCSGINQVTPHLTSLEKISIKLCPKQKSMIRSLCQGYTE